MKSIEKKLSSAQKELKRLKKGAGFSVNISGSGSVTSIKKKGNKIAAYASPMTIGSLDQDFLAKNLTFAADGNSHSHANKAILDIITQVLIDSWNTASAGSHTHENKAVLDKILALIKDLDTTEITDTAIFSALRVVGEITKRAISKTSDDSAVGLISFLKGIKTGDFVSGLSGSQIDATGNAEFNKILSRLLSVFTKGIEVGNYVPDTSGAALKTTDTGDTLLEVDKFIARKRAIFREVVIEKERHVGGAQISTCASMICNKVEEYDTYYRCYFDRGDLNETTGRYESENEFALDDQARCNVFTGAKLKYYWRLVVGIGDDYIDLSKTDYDADSDIPEPDDDIFQLGDRTDTDRQSAQIWSSYGPDAPSFIQYEGINSYSLEGKEQTKLSKSGNKLSGILSIENGSKGWENLTGLTDAFDNITTGSVNLLRNSGFKGDFTSLELDDAILDSSTELYSDKLKYWTATATVQEDTDSKSGYSVLLGSIEQSVSLVAGEKYILSYKAKGTSFDVTAPGLTITQVLTDGYVRYIHKFTATGNGTVKISGTGTLCEIQLERGTILTDYSPSPLDNSESYTLFQSIRHITDVIKSGSTSISGGLILSSMIQLGNYVDGVLKKVTAGISGVYTDDNDPLIWGAGDYESAIRALLNPNDLTAAKIAFSHGGRAVLNDAFIRGTIHGTDGDFSGTLRAGCFVEDSGGNKNVLALDRGIYDPEQPYYLGNYFQYGGSTYSCILNAPKGTLPTNTTYFKIIASKGADGAAGIVLKISGSQVFNYAKGATIPDVTNITLTATATPANASYTYAWYYFNSSSAWTNIGTSNSFYNLSYYSSYFDGNQARLRAEMIYKGVAYYDEITVIKVYSGSDAIEVLLSNESHTVQCDALGNLISGELAKAVTNVTVYKGGILATSGWSMTTSANGVEIGVMDMQTFRYIYLALMNTSGYVDITVTVDGIAFPKRFTITKSLAGTNGTDGTDGTNSATVSLYKRSATVLTAIDFTNEITYNFSQKSITAGTYGSWSQSIPSGTDPLYIVSATACSNTATDTILSTEWSTPVEYVRNGTNGTNGQDAITIEIENQNISVDTSNNSNNFSASSKIKVLRGNTYLPYTTSSESGKWAVIQVAVSGLSFGTSQSFTTEPPNYFQYTFSSFKKDTDVVGYADFTITVYGSTNLTFIRRVSITRSSNPLVLQQGIWDINTKYIGNAFRTDEVLYPDKAGSWYIAKTTAGEITAGTLPTDPTCYSPVSTFKNIATDTLLSQNSNLAGLIVRNQQLFSTNGILTGGGTSTNPADTGFMPNLMLDGFKGTISLSFKPAMWTESNGRLYLLLGGGNSSVYIDRAFNGSNRGWAAGYLPYTQENNGAVITLYWRAHSQGASGMRQRIFPDPSGYGQIIKEGGNVYSIELTSDTDRYIELRAVWAGQLYWVIEKDIIITPENFFIKQGEIILAGTVKCNSSGVITKEFSSSKYGFTFTVTKSAVGLYYVVMANTHSNPLNSNYMVMTSGYGYIYVDGVGVSGGYATCVSTSTSNFYIYTADDASENDSGFSFTVIATSEIDLRATK